MTDRSVSGRIEAPAKVEKMGSAKEDKSGRRREQILAAAEVAFARNGYRKTSIDRIARSLSIAKGTIYLYFRSKKELFLGVAERGIEQLAVEMKKLEELQTPLEKVRGAVTTFLGFFDAHREVAEILIQERSEFLEHVQRNYARHFKKYLGKMHAVFADGVRQGTFRKIEPDTAVQLLANMLHGTVYTHVLRKTRAPAAERAEVILDVFLNGLLGKRRSTGRIGHTR